MLSIPSLSVCLSICNNYYSSAVEIRICRIQNIREIFIYQLLFHMLMNGDLSISPVISST